VLEKQNRAERLLSLQGRATLFFFKVKIHRMLEKNAICLVNYCMCTVCFSKGFATNEKGAPSYHIPLMIFIDKNYFSYNVS
jgi:hypothetical protein